MWIIALNVTSAVLCFGIAVFAENFEITFTYWILGELAVMLILTEVMRRAVCKRVSRKEPNIGVLLVDAFAECSWLSVFFKQAKERIKLMPDLSKETSKQLRSVDSRFKTTLYLILISFVLCWLPYAVLTLLFSWNSNRNSFSFSIDMETSNQLKNIMILMNSIFDPIIIIWRMKDVRGALTKSFNKLKNFSRFSWSDWNFFLKMFSSFWFYIT